ncbi:MAG: nicotinamide mononucleotide transporter family protein [Clostridiales Family XIII bacterium]|nr:nicotinamide mononucleotide transporter family protein [Clostridiales Family XIII bacterium]
MKQTCYKLFKSKQWDIIWLIVGYVLVVVGAIHDWSGSFQLIWLTSLIGGFLGLTIVLSFANQKGKLGSGLGVIGACFDSYNYYNFGLLGNVFVGVYCAILYAKGFFTLGKELKVTKFTRLNLLVSVILAVCGAVVLYFFANTILPEGAPVWVLALNIIVFVVQVVSQYLMVEGKAVSWIGWILANFINIALNGYMVYTGQPGALIYLAMTVMYQLNSFKAAFLWFGYGEE